MSDHDVKRYIVTLKYQENGLGDLQSVNSAMINGGYSTTLSDDEGHPHELGTNSFGIVSALEEHEVAEQAAGYAQVALGQKPEVTVITLEAFLKEQP
ncbi:type V toxin-antitoxin system endoribonuclease antitoxin GhoS [uncultured Pantoea sp.]|uniref:type V toxin-antitoxin system endoribonuclease antitoxin GhoS n=1 Tax=uncultured Pantoea sp. TaxID=218084 RepID=UPI0025DA1633|nr:type V toxin-antitoxin system endoribonuclease antitoxin GhoS [uncultured Pantoea sp.]